MRIHSSSAAVLLYAATALYGQEVTTSTTGAVDVSESGNSTTTSIALSEAAPVPIVEIVVVAVGVILLLFAAIKMTSLVRQYSAAGSTNNGNLDPVSCAVCAFRQGVPLQANVFVCCSCHSANFIKREEGKPTECFSPAPKESGRRVSLHRVTDTFFKVDDDEEARNPDSADPAPSTIGAASPGSLPVAPSDSVNGDASQCTVCMDAAADTVLMPCAHGGICYKCADALVRKHFLTGGAKCIHCRASVESLVRLGEMNDLVAQGVEIEIPKATIIVRSKQ